MAETGKVIVYYRVTEIKCLDQDVEIVEETPDGITVRHTYRKTGTRTEFIPRDKLEGIIYEDVKTTRKPRKAKSATPVTVTAPKPALIKEEPVISEEDADDDGVFSETDDFDDSGDDFDDDEFE